ncbi:MAG: hypothetical protein E7301_07695 [Butyrivibrio sp.]|nr:hypothetical protein [Butyrivibrio sp.]
MGVNGITGVDQSTYYEPTAVKSEETAKTENVKPEKNDNTAAAVYEKSDVKAESPTSKIYKKNEQVVNMLKADLENRQNQLRDIVTKMMQGQGNAIGKADDMWKFLAKGDFTVDEATRKQAQEDISEDGYWGVKQTSQRILDFANALTGGDPQYIDKMKDAFEKGFKEATKAWGKELPEISKQTYDAVMKGFEEMKNKQSEETGEVEA